MYLLLLLEGGIQYIVIQQLFSISSTLHWKIFCFKERGWYFEIIREALLVAKEFISLQVHKNRMATKTAIKPRPGENPKIDCLILAMLSLLIQIKTLKFGIFVQHYTCL